MKEFFTVLALALMLSDKQTQDEIIREWNELIGDEEEEE